MHTDRFNTVTDGAFTVHHNGDYSGDVKIVIPTYHPNINYPKRVEFHDHSNSREKILSQKYLVYGDSDLIPDFYEVDLPFELLKQIVADKIRNDLMARVEEMDSDEVLRVAMQHLW